MTNTLTRIEQALNIKLDYIEGHNRQSLTIVNCTLTEEQVRQAVAAGKCEWQDPSAPDCNNNDGMLYIYLPADEAQDDGELFVGIDIPAAYATYC